MRTTHRALAGACLVGLVVLAAPTALARDRVLRAQLDRDTPRERVVVQKARCRSVSPYGCSRLVVRDGRRRAVLTPFTQRPRHPYGWDVTKLRFLDFTGDGVPEVFWRLDSSGGTVSSPSLVGVTSWTGSRSYRLFTFANGRRRKPPRGYRYIIFVTERIVRPGGGRLPEIRTRESLHHELDGNCCPSAYRITRHRWNGRRIAPVPGSTRIVRAS
jgi:hypothetical protein